MTTVPEKLSDLRIVPPSWGWRRGQRELAQRIADSPKKIIMLEAECGTGKSLIPIAAARSMGHPVLVLVQTIQLQEQYLRDFEGATLLKGRRHYTCNKTDKAADRAPCTIGYKCSLKGYWDRATGTPQSVPECHYFRAKAEARLAPISIQNYAYWLGESSGTRSIFARQPIIVCDEAHELDQILMSAATMEVTTARLSALDIIPPKDTATIAAWKEWAQRVSPELATWLDSERGRLQAAGVDVGDAEDDPGREEENFEVKDIDAQIEKFKMARELYEILEGIVSSVTEEDWVLDQKTYKTGAVHWFFKPIFGKYGFKRLLAAATHKIILMSAFLAPDMLIRTLGLDPEDVDVIEAPRTFDRTKSPIYFLPTRKMSFKSTENELRYVIGVMDEIIDFYKPKKGIIHVPSVGLRDKLLRYSRHRMDFIHYEGSGSANASPTALDKDGALQVFQRPGFSILLGQSVSTGVDLPYLAEWQIIPKIWFAPIDDPAIAARKERDKDFYPYHTICQIVQATGRVKRAADHDGPTVILDEQFRWFYQRHRESFPQWFRDALIYNGWGRFPATQKKLPLIAQRMGVSL